MSIVARLSHNSNTIPVQVLEAYTVGDRCYACVQTLDGSAPFWTVGSKYARFTAWTTVTTDQLTDVRCTHDHTAWETQGGYHFSYEVGPWDNIEEVHRCLDCGQRLDTPAALPVSVEETVEIPY